MATSNGSTERMEKKNITLGTEICENIDTLYINIIIILIIIIIIIITEFLAIPLISGI